MSQPSNLHASVAGLLLAAALGAAQAQAQVPEQVQKQAQEQPQTQEQKPAQEPPQAQERAANDPFEGWNRAIFGVNQGLDDFVLKPVSISYRAVMPELLRSGVSNFFANFRDGWSAINALLQAKPVVAAQMTTRVATNLLFGMGGFFDVASELGIVRQREDFGQTLGRWCIPAGPYLVWPLLGPSSLRDSLALPLDLSWATGKLTNDGTVRFGLTVLQVVDIRTSLLDVDRMIDALAIDRYVFIRDAHLARRRSLVFDGEPPEPPDECRIWPPAVAQ